MGCCGSIKKDLESEILQLKTDNIELTEQHSNLKKECNSHKHKLKELSINSANQLEKSLSMINTHKLKLQGKVEELSNVNSLVSKLKSELEDIKEDNMTLIEDNNQFIDHNNKLSKKIILEKQISEKIITELQNKLDCYKDQVKNNSTAYSNISIQNKTLQSEYSKLKHINNTLIRNLQDDKFIDGMVSHICTKNIPPLVKDKYIRFATIFAKNLIKNMENLQDIKKKDKSTSWLSNWFNQYAEEQV